MGSGIDVEFLNLLERHPEAKKDWLRVLDERIQNEEKDLKST